MVFVVTALGVGLSVGPYLDLRESSARLAAMEQEVTVLQQGNQALQTQAARLEKESYLEALARKDLNLARPGEDVFIVTGLTGTTETPVTPEAAAPAGPGPVERVIDALRQLF